MVGLRVSGGLDLFDSDIFSLAIYYIFGHEITVETSCELGCTDSEKLELIFDNQWNLTSGRCHKVAMRSYSSSVFLVHGSWYKHPSLPWYEGPSTRYCPGSNNLGGQVPRGLGSGPML